MAETRANEWEFQGQVINWIKKRLEEGGLPFKNATNDSSLYGSERVKFPDVLLTLDFECRVPFCGWELKTPKTDVRDRELLKKAVKKAQELGAKYFVTWNMQTGIIWRTPEKLRITVTEGDKVQEIGPDHRINSVSDVRDRTKAELLEDMCRRLLVDLARLYEHERVNLPVPDRTVFVGMVSEASRRLAGRLVEDINRARADRVFDKRLNAWAKKQGVSKYDQSYYETLAQQIAYKIIGKLLFYLTLRRQNVNLPRLELRSDNYEAAMKRMRSLFQQALEVDYQAVFEPDITDEIKLSDGSAAVIVDLVEKLKNWTFELMPLDVIGNVFEKLVPEDARHKLGQYFTPNDLVDLIVTFCVRSKDDFVMDPTCGTGTFLIRSYERLRMLGMRTKAHHKLLEQVWGFDIAGFPAELATINLYRQDLSDYLNFPRVLTKDFFDVRPGARFEFPPPKKTAKSGERIVVEIPKFDAIVGNFPFIRQELIERAEKGYKKKLEAVLFEDWAKEYPELFSDAKGRSAHKLRLSGQADIYAYLYFHAAAHLQDGGRMGFITSNSWLDVAYGYELQKFFLSRFKLIGIFESRCEPWFEQSAVNTVFTIIERCGDEKERHGNWVRFVKVKKPLRELFPQDPVADAQARNMALERFVDKIEELGERWEVCGGKDFRKFEAINERYVKQPEIVSYEDDEVRVRMIRQRDLLEQVQDAGETVKWGPYLRGPDIYFEILGKCANIFVPLREIADIRRGITTGINKFFYLTKEQAKHWGIEKRFLKPVVTSTREIPGLFVEVKNLNWQVFLCDLNKAELRGTGALRYIKAGEQQKTSNGTPWPKVPSVKGRKHWYSVPKNIVADFLILRFRDRRHYTPINKAKAEVGDVVFVGAFRDPVFKDFGCAFLNSVLTVLFAEVFGRTNLGDGLLTTYGPEIGALLLPVGLKRQRVEKKIRKILELFEKLGRRKVLSFGKEVQRDDRKNFELAIFNLIGLGEDEYQRVCTAVNELIEERHFLAKLRPVRQKRRVEQDLEKLREEIAEEVLPNGVHRFPDAFVKAAGKGEWEEVSVAAGDLKLGERGMDIQEICDGEGKHLMEVRGIERAKYIVYAKRPGEQVIRIQKSAIIVKKAVQDYEVYVRETREKLYRAFMEKCGDHNLSENLTRQVCGEFGLPDVQ